MSGLDFSQPSAAFVAGSGGNGYRAAGTLNLQYVALRWDHYYARKIYDSIAYGPPQQLLIDANWLMMRFTAGWCLICAISLLLMLGQCTALSHYLNLNVLF
jgi:hypothetical protein